MKENLGSTEKVAHSVRGAAQVADLGKDILYQAIKERDLHARRVGSKIVILHDDLMEWLRSLPEYSGPEGGRTRYARMLAEHEGCEA